MNTETANGTALIFDRSGQAMFPELTAGASAHLVRTSPLQENEQDLTETDQALSEKCSVFLANLKKKTDPNGLSTRMLRECCQAIAGGDFLSIILAMEELGYDIEWYLFNSKYHGVPQNRERVYTLGHLRRYGRCKVFPISGTAGEDSADIKIAGHYNGYRRNMQTFTPDGITEALSTCGGENREHHVALPLVIQGNEVVVVPVIWYDKYKCYIAIRKLTPKECFRLQGWTDDYFAKAEFVNSNSQLYKQAGNGVTVNVVYEIGKAMKEPEVRCKRA